MNRRYISGGFVACLLHSFIFAQSDQAIQKQYSFQYITIDQGLSSNNSRIIAQDAEGYIWVGTPNGVDRFDGNTIIQYRHDPDDSTSLSSNDVSSIFLDSKNNLWISNKEGLDIYNRDYDNFTKFKQGIFNQIKNVLEIVEDKNGKLWFGTDSGLYVYNLNNSQSKYFGNEEDNPYGIPASPVFKLLVDRNNNIWISILNEGIGIYNQSTEKFRFFKNDPDDPTSISGNRIERFYEDSKGRIWMGTFNNGFNLYNPDNSTFTRFIPDPEDSYSTRVRAIFEDYKGNFFVGTRGGLYLMDQDNNSFLHYAHSSHEISTLSQNSILCHLIDQTGCLWFGTFSGGVNYADMNRKMFVHYKSKKDDNHFLNTGNINAILEDTHGNIWVGTTDGINLLNRTTNTFSYFYHDPENDNTIAYNDIKAFELDNKGNMWIGTNRGGLDYYDVKSNTFYHYKHNPEDPNSISGDKIYYLMRDKDNNLWILTNLNIDDQYSSIDILPEGSDKFIHLNEKGYFGFDENEEGDVFIGGINGFWIFSRRDSLFSFISNDSLIDKVHTIRRDSKNRLWIGSEKGLVKYSPEDKSFEWFSEDNGYPIEVVLGILEDNDHNLWISTNSGLIKGVNIVESTDSVTFKVFDKDDGLQSKQFTYNSYYKLSTGEMAFGGINGFNIFYPNEIVDNPIPPNVLLTNLRIFNETTPIGEKVRGRLILKKSIGVTDEIELGRKQNVFTIEFAALHYANPDKNTFKYKLEGFDEEWQYRKASNNFATYSNLPAGKYTFLVTAANYDGVWNKEPARLKITIIPPFWKTWWFYGIVLVIVTGAVAFFIRLREAQLKHDKETLEKKLKEGEKELDKRKAEIEKQKHELEQKEQQERTQKWFNVGMAKFADILSKDKENIEVLSHQLIKNIVQYLEADQGGFFLVNDQDKDNIYLELISHYAYNNEKLKMKVFQTGEGLIGECYKSKKVINIDDVPDSYSKLTSGLGECKLKTLTIIPMIMNDHAIGVIELGSQTKLEGYKIEFLYKLSDNIASVVATFKSNVLIKEMLFQSQKQSEQLQSQEEELRQNMEEMKATQEEADRREGKLRTDVSRLEMKIQEMSKQILDRDKTIIEFQKKKQ